MLGAAFDNIKNEIVNINVEGLGIKTREKVDKLLNEFLK